MKSLGEHFAKGYIVEPAGVHPDTVRQLNRQDTSGHDTSVICDTFFGSANRLVFMRNGILVAYTFNLVTTSGGSLTITLNLP